MEKSFIFLQKIYRFIEIALPLTRGLKHWGLSGCANILPRIKFVVIGQESSPQSVTISYSHPLTALLKLIMIFIHHLAKPLSSKKAIIFFSLFVFCYSYTSLKAQNLAKFYGVALGYDHNNIQLGGFNGHYRGDMLEQQTLLYNYNYKEKTHGITASYTNGMAWAMALGADFSFRTNFYDPSKVTLKPKIVLIMPAFFSCDFGYDIPFTSNTRKGFGWSFNVKIPIKILELKDDEECQTCWLIN
jgi:hypothetical protein